MPPRLGALIAAPLHMVAHAAGLNTAGRNIATGRGSSPFGRGGARQSLTAAVQRAHQRSHARHAPATRGRMTVGGGSKVQTTERNRAIVPVRSYKRRMGNGQVVTVRGTNRHHPKR